MNKTRTVQELVQEARRRVRNLTVADVSAAIARGALLVDIREPAELEANGRIPGALPVPRGMLEFHADPTSPYHLEPLLPEREIVLHCASGGRSALAADALQQMGYTSVAHLDGGIKAWKEAGQPVEP